MWIDDAVVWDCLETQESETLFSSDVKFAVSENGVYCLILRTHAVWETPGGWRVGHYPPDSSTNKRQFVSFFKKPIGDEPGVGCRVALPNDAVVTSIESIQNRFLLLGSNIKCFAEYEKLDLGCFKFATGFARSSQSLTDEFEYFFTDI